MCLSLSMYTYLYTHAHQYIGAHTNDCLRFYFKNLDNRWFRKRPGWFLDYLVNSLLPFCPHIYSYFIFKDVALCERFLKKKIDLRRLEVCKVANKHGEYCALV